MQFTISNFLYSLKHNKELPQIKFRRYINEIIYGTNNAAGLYY